MQTKNQQVVSCPPCGENVGLPTKRGAYKVTSLMSPSIGPADHFLRKGGRKGFTLIELLVVVLIIGILAAVAVPQYKLTVDKARFSEYLHIASTVKKAQEIYYLANGNYSLDWNELDIQLGDTTPTDSRVDTPNGFRVVLNSNPRATYVYGPIKNIIFISAYEHTQGNWKNQSACYAPSDVPYANKLCKAITGKNGTTGIAGSFVVYWM